MGVRKHHRPIPIFVTFLFILPWLLTLIALSTREIFRAFIGPVSLRGDTIFYGIYDYCIGNYGNCQNYHASCDYVRTMFGYVPPDTGGVGYGTLGSSTIASYGMFGLGYGVVSPMMILEYPDLVVRDFCRPEWAAALGTIITTLVIGLFTILAGIACFLTWKKTSIECRIGPIKTIRVGTISSGASTGVVILALINALFCAITVGLIVATRNKLFLDVWPLIQFGAGFYLLIIALVLDLILVVAFYVTHKSSIVDDVVEIEVERD